MLLVETFPVGAFECNCTVIACADTKDAIVIDPGGDPDRIMDVVRHYDLTVRFAIHTHAHLDHIASTRDIKESTGATIALHRADLPLYDAWQIQAQMFGWKVRPMLPIDHYLTDGDTLTFGKRETKVVFTPGHTPGSCCFSVEDAADRRRLLFSGDTLFARSVGRTDLPGGDFDTLETSIQQKLYSLDPDFQVIPGHGPPTTIGDEQRANPFVRPVQS